MDTKITEDEATLILLSLSYVIACFKGDTDEATLMLSHIDDGLTQAELTGMCKSILDKLERNDILVVKPFNKLLA